MLVWVFPTQIMSHTHYPAYVAHCLTHYPTRHRWDMKGALWRIMIDIYIDDVVDDKYEH